MCRHVSANHRIMSKVLSAASLPVDSDGRHIEGCFFFDIYSGKMSEDAVLALHISMRMVRASACRDRPEELKFISR
jgi:hypothetical protein